LPERGAGVALRESSAPAAPEDGPRLRSRVRGSGFGAIRGPARRGGPSVRRTDARAEVEARNRCGSRPRGPPRRAEVALARRAAPSPAWEHQLMNKPASQKRVLALDVRPRS